MHVKIKDFIGNQYADFAIYLSTWYLFNVHLNIRECNFFWPLQRGGWLCISLTRNSPKIVFANVSEHCASFGIKNPIWPLLRGGRFSILKSTGLHVDN